MVTLNVHLHEFTDERGISRLVALASNNPVAVSVCPLHLTEERYDRTALDVIRRIVSKEGNVLGQRGETSMCFLSKHEKTDRFHENKCPYSFEPITYEDQKQFMQRGKSILATILDKEPELYVPPNHFYDRNSIMAAKNLGFEYFSTYDTDINNLE